MLDLRPQQKAAVKAIREKPALLLADVGAGKTATALRAVGARSLVRGLVRTLVVGTRRICNTVWEQEVETWLPSHSYASVAGKKQDERRQILEDESILIVGINFENLAWAFTTYGSELAKMFPQLVVDESSKLENPASKTFKVIRDHLHEFEWRLPMTGTPQANHLHDLWGSVYLADLGESLGYYKQAFLQTYFHQVRRSVGTEWLPRAGAAAAIAARLEKAGVVHRMPFVWHAPVEIDVLLPCNPDVKWIMKRIDEGLDEQPDVVIDGITFARDGSRVYLKMLQLSSGYIYDDKGRVVHLHIDKLGALMEIVAEAHGEPVMVVFQFEHERDAILEQFPQAVLLDDDDTLAAWNNREIEMLLVHPRSCGYGLNAQLGGCDMQVWFTPTPDAELYAQTIGRLNRPGNDKTIRIFRLIMQGTKDRASYAVVAARQRGERATLEMYE